MDIFRNHFKVWVDIGHSPHVPFFVPIIRELEKEGHEVVITARNSFQTFDLLEKYGLKYKKMGFHYGNNRVLKVYSHVIRAMGLFFFALGQGFSVTASHGSPSQLMAAYLLRIPQWMTSDYEPSFGTFMRMCQRVFVPEVIPDNLLLKTLKPQQISKYPGLKEDAYVRDFQPDPELLEALNINLKNIVVTMRPPATYAHYHNRDSEELMAAAIRFVLRKPEVTLIFLPRTLKQKDEALELSREYDGRIIVPPMVLDGLNVVWNSDLVISGGGTMNREAAALGVPVYSIFRGPICSVDRYLESEGRMVCITSTKDLDRIPLEKRRRTVPRSDTSFNLASFLAQKIIATARVN